MSSKSKAIRNIVFKYIGEEGVSSAAQSIASGATPSLTNPTDVYALQRDRYKKTLMLKRKKPK